MHDIAKNTRPLVQCAERAVVTAYISRRPRPRLYLLLPLPCTRGRGLGHSFRALAYVDISITFAVPLSNLRTEVWPPCRRCFSFRLGRGFLSDAFVYFLGFHVLRSNSRSRCCIANGLSKPAIGQQEA